jgi:hypothetical protein
MIGFSMCVEIDGADVIRIEGAEVPSVVLSDTSPTLPLERSLLGA